MADELLRLRAKRAFRLSPDKMLRAGEEFEMGEAVANHVIAGQLAEKVSPSVAARSPSLDPGTYHRSDLRASDHAASVDSSSKLSNRTLSVKR